MKNTLYPYRLFIAFAACTLTLSATAQPINPLFRHLSPDAYKVYHINIGAITSKLGWEDMINSIPAPKALNDQNMMDIVKDPSRAGVDVKQDVLISESGYDPFDSASYVTVIFHLTDSAKFIALLKNKDKGIHILRIPGKGRALGKDNAAIAWDDKLAVLTIVTPPGKDKSAKKGAMAPKKPGVTPPSPTALYTLAAAKNSVAALLGYTGTMYTTDPEFLKGFSDDADFHVWAPQGAGIAMLANAFKSKSPDMAKTLSRSMRTTKLHVLTAIRFDAGKISIRSTTLLPPDSLEFVKKFNTHPLNADLIARIPGKDLMGIVNFHFDPAIIGFILDKYKMRSKADSAMSGKGLTMDDIQKAFQGDFLFAVVAPPAGSADSGSAKTPQMYFVTTINDMTAFLKIAAKLKLTKDPSDTTAGLLGKMKTDFTLKDNILVVGATKELTDGYFANTMRRDMTLVTPQVQNNPFSIVVDIKAVASYFQNMSAEPNQKTQQMLHFMNALDRLTFAGGGLVDGNKSEIYFELKMADASENSLKSLFKLMH